MGTVKIKNEDIFVVNNFRIAISENCSIVYFLKDTSHKDVDLEEYIESTRPIVKYLNEEGFITKKSVKVAILSNH